MQVRRPTPFCYSGSHYFLVWGRKPEDKDSPIDWVELKTSACIENPKDMLKYERKLQKFWAQSFLLGVPRIIVGFRTKRGILDHMEEVETKTIPGLVKRQGKGSWDGNVAINFSAAFLECKIDCAIVQNMAEQIYRVEGDYNLRRIVAYTSKGSVGNH